MTYEITIQVIVPDNVTHKQVESWAKFCTGKMGSLEAENPIYEQRGSDIDAISCEVRQK